MDQINIEKQLYEKLRVSLAPESLLYERMNMCGEDRGIYPYFYRFYCKQPGCPQCRVRFRRRCIASAKKAFAQADNSSCAFFTIVLPPGESAQDACAEFTRARQGIRNTGHKYRREWKNTKVMGFLEMDALDSEMLSLVGPERSRLLTDIGVSLRDDFNPTWIPTIHGIALLGDISYQDFRIQLSERWNHTGQTHVIPFHSDKSLDENITKTICYSTKHTCGTNLRGAFDPWPSSWVAEYYTAIHNSSKGFRGCVFTRGIERQRIKEYEINKPLHNTYYCPEPLPTII